MRNKNLKSLQTQFSELTSEISATSNKIKTLNIERRVKKKRCDQLKKQIEEFKVSGDTIISEHAILQYLQRVKEVDIEAIKKEILNDNVRSMIEKLGKSGRYPNKDFQLVLKDNVVVTIIK